MLKETNIEKICVKLDVNFYDYSENNGAKIFSKAKRYGEDLLCRDKYIDKEEIIFYNWNCGHGFLYLPDYYKSKVTFIDCNIIHELGIENINPMGYKHTINFINCSIGDLNIDGKNMKNSSINILFSKISNLKIEDVSTIGSIKIKYSNIVESKILSKRFESKYSNFNKLDIKNYLTYSFKNSYIENNYNEYFLNKSNNLNIDDLITIKIEYKCLFSSMHGKPHTTIIKYNLRDTKTLNYSKNHIEIKSSELFNLKVNDDDESDGYLSSDSDNDYSNYKHSYAYLDDMKYEAYRDYEENYMYDDVDDYPKLVPESNYLYDKTMYNYNTMINNDPNYLSCIHKTTITI